MACTKRSEQIDLRFQRRADQVNHYPVFEQFVPLPLPEVHDVPADAFTCWRPTHKRVEVRPNEARPTSRGSKLALGNAGAMAGATPVGEGGNDGALGVAFELVHAVGGSDADGTMPHHVVVPEAFESLAGLILAVVFVDAAKNHLGVFHLLIYEKEVPSV